MKKLLLILMICSVALVGCKKESGTETAKSETAVQKPAAPEKETPVEETPKAEPKEEIITPAPEKTSEPQAAVMPEKLGDTAWPLEGVEWIKGGPVTLEKGTVYVVEFWATWCPPCVQSIPHLTEVQHKFKDKGVVVVGISAETADKVKPFVEEKAETMEYNVAINPSRSVSDGYMKAYKQNGIPCAFVVNTEGKVVWVGHPMGGLDEVLEKVVAGNYEIQ